MVGKGFDMNIEKRVLILAIYKKQESESLTDVLITLENSGLFKLKIGKRYLKELKKEGFLVENELGFKGLGLAKEIEGEFKIDS